MSATTRDEQVRPSPDEDTPLLSSELPLQKPTPVPWAQVWILLVLQLAEPLTSQVIYPFTPEFVRNVGITHGDESRVGYYQSIFFVTQTITVLHWSRLSDFVGRKPVILVGLFGLSLSMFGFGLSTTYWSAALRGFNGALNGNVSVIKSIIAEITDPTNMPQVYAYVPIAWSFGGALGPTIGGSLSRPADRFPDTFGNSEFLRKYPYFLPCAVSASFSAFAWIFTFVFLRETVSSPKTLRNLLTKRSRSSSSSSSCDGLSETDDAEKRYPLRQLVTRRRVLLSVTNYATLSLVEISFRAIQPLFLSTPISSGGLGLDPPSIGKILACLGILNGIFQVTCFVRAHAIWGTKRLFVGGLCCAVPVFALFPVMNAIARIYGVGLAVYSVVALQIVFSLVWNSCFGCIYMYVSAASPNRASLGATNGIAQFLVSITRIIGPAASTSLFSLSMAEGYLGSSLVYIVLLMASLATIAFGTTLPRQVWQP
ncbi:member of major facilitator superfamily multidrug-resistance, DHA1 sub-family [Russula emetica]|nr:member of major facilitator superfamily multidrug-resistance, DHA1 sub-family [Russula emetica]